MNLQDAFYQTVHDTPGGCEALAVRMNMSSAILRNKANPNAAGNTPGLFETDRIVGITGDHRLVHVFAANHGYVCVKVEKAESASDMGVLELMTKYWSTNGEVGTEIMKALADGKITKDELEQVHAAVKRTERDLEQVFARLSGMAEK
jgi:hypothetical protein